MSCHNTLIINSIIEKNPHNNLQVLCTPEYCQWTNYHNFASPPLGMIVFFNWPLSLLKLQDFYWGGDGGAVAASWIWILVSPMTSQFTAWFLTAVKTLSWPLLVSTSMSYWYCDCTALIVLAQKSSSKD